MHYVDGLCYTQCSYLLCSQVNCTLIKILISIQFVATSSDAVTFVMFLHKFPGMDITVHESPKTGEGAEQL